MRLTKDTIKALPFDRTASFFQPKIAFTFKCRVNIILKIITQCLLFCFFLYIFGVPAVQKFLDKKVLVVKSRRDTKGTPAPAVTIVVRNDETNSGWEAKGQLGSVGFVQTLCSNANTTNAFANCIQKNTYNKSELIRNVRIGSGRVCRLHQSQ